MAITTAERGTPLHMTVQCVTNMVLSGVPFERVEAFIEGQSGLDTEVKAVLWLVAWSGGAPSAVAAELGRHRVGTSDGAPTHDLFVRGV